MSFFGEAHVAVVGGISSWTAIALVEVGELTCCWADSQPAAVADEEADDDHPLDEFLLFLE